MRVNEARVLRGVELLLPLPDLLPLLASESVGTSSCGEVVEGGKGLSLERADGVIEALGRHEGTLSHAAVARAEIPRTCTARLRSCVLRVWST